MGDDLTRERLAELSALVQSVEGLRGRAHVPFPDHALKAAADALGRAMDLPTVRALLSMASRSVSVETVRKLLYAEREAVSPNGEIDFGDFYEACEKDLKEAAEALAKEGK